MVSLTKMKIEELGLLDNGMIAVFRSGMEEGSFVCSFPMI